MSRLPLFASFVLFVALCVSLTYWALQLFKPAARAVAAPPPVAAEVDLQAAAGLFGGRAAVAAASNFQLKGVVAALDGNDGVAILSANGKPAQSVRQGAEIVPGAVVKEVHRGYVVISEGGLQKRVELPQTAAKSAALASPSGSAAPAFRPNPPSPPSPPAPPAQPISPQVGVTLAPAAVGQLPADTGSGLVPMAPAH